MNKMCDVYDMILKLKNYNKEFPNATYKVTENIVGKVSDIYYIYNLIAEAHDGYLLFHDINDYILLNKKIIMCLIIDSIDSIELSDKIKIVYSNLKKITIEFNK